MKIELNRAQRIVIFACAAAILIFQLSVFADEGIHGAAWLFSLLAVTGLLFLGFAGTVGKGSIQKQPQENDSVAPLINQRARDVAALTAQLAAHLEKHFHVNGLSLAVPMPGASLTTEAVLPVFSLATIVYLESKDPLLNTEYIIYRDLIAKALRSMIASHMDKDSAAIDKQMGLEVNPGGVSAQMTKEIIAYVGARMNEQQQLAMKLIQSPQEAKNLIALYQAVAVGEKATDHQLSELYETVFAMILDQMRRVLFDRPVAQVG